MPESRLAPNSAKQFDARTASLVVGQEPIQDIESFGYDQSKDHELEYTLDQKAIWVKSTPELTGTFVMKATSPSIPRVETLFLRDRPFNITAQLAFTAANQEQDVVQFVGCMITDFSMSEYEIDGMPTVTAEWQGVNRAEDTASRAAENAPEYQEGVMGPDGGATGGGGG